MQLCLMKKLVLCRKLIYGSLELLFGGSIDVVGLIITELLSSKMKSSDVILVQAIH